MEESQIPWQGAQCQPLSKTSGEISVGERRARNTLLWLVVQGGAGLTEPPSSEGNLLLTSHSDALPQANGDPRRWELPPEQPCSRLLSSPASLSPRGSKADWQAGRDAAPGPRSPHLQSASSRHAVPCAHLTNLLSEHLLVCFSSLLCILLLSVCQNTNGPLLGPCHLVSIRVTLGTSSCLLNFCA